MFFPTRCPLCDQVGPAPCMACSQRFVRAPAVTPIAGCDSVGARFVYDGEVRALLLAMKYRNRRDGVGFCAAELARAAPLVEVVTWPPTTRHRARTRGFDQAEILARAVARRLGVPARSTLRRCGGRAQTGSDAQARRIGPQFLARSGPVMGRSVLVCDDVVTTGSTFRAAALALRDAGAREVHALGIAWTPPPGRAIAAARTPKPDQ
jgi:predicted amidophosphoribosyltransferase